MAVMNWYSAVSMHVSFSLVLHAGDTDPVYYAEINFAYRSIMKMFIDSPMARKIGRDF